MSWNEWERDMFDALVARVEQLEREAADGTWWLIECGSPASYFCGDGDWCNNPNHAWRFDSKESAELKASSMKTMAPIRICDHLWSKS